MIQFMMSNDGRNYYHLQVELLLKVLPYVAKESCFALKGGTAINFFVRDMPRLSVDIDLTYLPIEPRDITLVHIEEALTRIRLAISEHHRDIVIKEKRTQNDLHLSKLFITQKSVLIKIEPNEILRGTVYPCETRDLSSKVEQIFQRSISDMPVVSLADLYGGKICAALARQHPRDLFDIKLLFENEGITDSIRQAFVIYLASSPRPAHELLNPKPVLQDMHKAFEEGFVGMTENAISYNELVKTRHRLITHLLQHLTISERQFLLSIKMGEPDWSLMPIDGIRNLPALAWKTINIQKMDKNKHVEALGKLKKVLEF
jgi:predicted nucleotidyltransferase component of viral defense system